MHFSNLEFVKKLFVIFQALSNLSKYKVSCEKENWIRKTFKFNTKIIPKMPCLGIFRLQFPKTDHIWNSANFMFGQKMSNTEIFKLELEKGFCHILHQCPRILPTLPHLGIFGM